MCLLRQERRAMFCDSIMVCARGHVCDGVAHLYVMMQLVEMWITQL